MIRALWALTLNGFREARRNRVTLVVALFALGLVLSSTLVTEITVVTFERVATDVGLGAMTILLVFLTVFLSTGQLGRDIERRTIFLVVSKPVSRGVYLVGRLLGNMLTIAVLLAAMGVVFAVTALLYGFPMSAPKVLAISMLWVELLVLGSLGFLFASFSGQIVAALVTTSLFVVGHLSSDIYKLAAKSSSVLLQAVGKGCYYVLPNLSRLSFRSQASYGVESPWETVASSAAYGVAYSVAVLALAVMVFTRRDFK